MNHLSSGRLTIVAHPWSERRISQNNRKCRSAPVLSDKRETVETRKNRIALEDKNSTTFAIDLLSKGFCGWGSVIALSARRSTETEWKIAQTRRRRRRTRMCYLKSFACRCESLAQHSDFFITKSFLIAKLIINSINSSSTTNRLRCSSSHFFFLLYWLFRPRNVAFN